MDFHYYNKYWLLFFIYLSLTACNKAAEIPAKATIITDAKTYSVIQDKLSKKVKAPELIVLPTGSNTLGDLVGEGMPNEKPTYKVNIKKAFAIGKYEVTFDEYDYFCEQTGRAKPEDEGWGRGKLPVINVTWDDAHDYVLWLTKITGKRYSLPTEAQWEYAARAGTQTNYWWGNEPGDKLAQCANCAAIHRCKDCKNVELLDDGTVEVNSFKPNPFGLYNVHGNVAEWTLDCGNDVNLSEESDGYPRFHGDCNRRIMKDGSWWNNTRFIRSSIRGYAVDGIDYKSQHVGIRVAREIK